MVKLDGVQTFVAIVETGSISAAARRLSISKSVVSQRLTNLEDALGCRLVQRSTRRMGLTDSGGSFYERSVRILADLDDAVSAVSEQRGQISGPLRLAAPMSFSVLHLGPALYPFLEENPSVDLKLYLNDRMVDLVSEGYDMAIRIGRLSDSSLIARTLTSSRRVVVCSPQYESTHRLPETFGELEEHACICYTNITPFNEWKFEVAGKHVAVKLRSRVQVNNGAIQRDAAEAGLGLAILPTFLVSKSVAERKLIVVPLDAEPVPDTVYAVYPQNRHLSATVRALTDRLQQKFGNPPYWDTPVFARG